jgi:hypothetical protein
LQTAVLACGTGMEANLVRGLVRAR